MDKQKKDGRVLLLNKWHQSNGANRLGVAWSTRLNRHFHMQGCGPLLSSKRTFTLLCCATLLEPLNTHRKSEGWSLLMAMLQVVIFKLNNWYKNTSYKSTGELGVC